MADGGRKLLQMLPQKSSAVEMRLLVGVEAASGRVVVCVHDAGARKDRERESLA